MKKVLLIVLALSMLLTGCNSGKEVEPEVVTKKDTVVANPVVSKTDIEVNLIENISDEQIEKALKEIGYEGKIKYKKYPEKDYLFSEYITVDGKLYTVYLKNGSLEDKMFDYSKYDNSMLMSSTKADMYSPSWGILDTIGNAVGGLISDSSTYDAGGSFVEMEEGFSANSIMEAPMIPYISDEPLMNTSEYKDVKEMGFTSVKTSPLSTFAADVDTASYTNFRSIIRKNLGEDSLYYSLDSAHDIRIEEMINYFDYDFSEESDEDFTVTTEIAQTPWNDDTKLLLVNVKAKELPMSEHKGSNIVFLVDTSGSMEDEDKLYLLIDALKLLTNELTENDTVSLVTYASNDRVVFEGLKGNQKEEIIKALEELTAYGSTNGEGGIKKAYKVAEKYKENHSNSRIIMCSDGDLNVGISSEDDLIDLIEKKRETGIYLSVLGFGLGNYKDNKMEALADNGNGNYHYIDSIYEANKVLVKDLLSTTVTLGDDVKFQLEFNPTYIKGYRKIGYENRDMANEDFADDTKDGGEVGYGHEVTVIYEIVPADSELEIGEQDLKYQESTVSDSNVKDWLTVSIRHKPHGEKESILNEYIVDETSVSAEPSDNFKFISNVVAFGLLVNESNYIEDWTVDTVIDNLNSMELKDAEKIEFNAVVQGYKEYMEKSKNKGNENNMIYEPMHP